MKGASLEKASALLASIRLGWKALPEANKPAYYEHSKLDMLKVL
jgi:hypothetical protein